MFNFAPVISDDERAGISFKAEHINCRKTGKKKKNSFVFFVCDSFTGFLISADVISYILQSFKEDRFKKCEDGETFKIHRVYIFKHKASKCSMQRF